MISFLKRHRYFILIFIIAILLRLPGIHIPYFQDEYKWAVAVAPGSPYAGTIPHPPLSEKIYVLSDRVFGNDHLRYTPFIFSLITLTLLYALVRYRFGQKEALWASFFFTVSFYSVLASLMVDTDGQILPALFLTAVLMYFKWQDARDRKSKIVWGATFVATLLVGFLVKLSFIIPLGALLIDILISYRHVISKKIIILSTISIGLMASLFVLMLINAHYFFPQFNIATSFTYWKHFIVFSNRNYFQTGIQFAKSILYLSPLLIAPAFCMSRKQIRETRLFLIFVVCGLLFYLVVFDFSIGALDRYMQFLIVPLSLISGIVVARTLTDRRQISSVTYQICFALLVFLIGIFFIHHSVPPQHPKIAWIGRITSLSWNFLFPFTGGSGPLGFYMSFLFMASAFILSGIFVVTTTVKKNLRTACFAFIVAVGLLYNGVFIEEFLYGSIYGNSVQVLRSAEQYIASHSEIKKVITYNDAGTYELLHLGKYERRIYADPAYEEGYKKTLNAFRGYYLVVDIPRFNRDSIYPKYFNSCNVTYREIDKMISATVYDCRGVSDIKT